MIELETGDNNQGHRSRRPPLADHQLCGGSLKYRENIGRPKDTLCKLIIHGSTGLHFYLLLPS